MYIYIYKYFPNDDFRMLFGCVEFHFYSHKYYMHIT